MRGQVRPAFLGAGRGAGGGEAPRKEGNGFNGPLVFVGGAGCCESVVRPARSADARWAVPRADLAADPSTARDMLFSNPGAELPDVYLSESVVFVSES